MELEKIVLIEVIEVTEARKTNMFSFIRGSWLQIFRCEHTACSYYRNQESKTGLLPGEGHHGRAIEWGLAGYKDLIREMGKGRTPWEGRWR